MKPLLATPLVAW